MKHLFFLTLIVVCFSAKAQSYMRANVAYGFSAQSSVLGLSGNESYTYSPSTGQGTRSGQVKSETGSLGAGTQIGFTLGWKTHKPLGFEFTTEYVSGKKYSFAYDYTSSGGNRSTTTNTWKATQLRLIPTLVWTFSEGKLAPFARLGLLLPLKTETIFEEEQKDILGTSTSFTNQTAKVTSAFSPGLHTAVGLSYRVTPHLSLSGELTYNALFSTWKELTYTRYDDDGINKLFSMSESEKHYIFVKEMTFQSGTPNPNEPSKAMSAEAPKQSMSSIALRLGLTISFGKKRE